MLVTGLDSLPWKAPILTRTSSITTSGRGTGPRFRTAAMWSDGAAGSSPWEGKAADVPATEREVFFGMQDLSGHAVDSFDVILDGTVRVSSLTSLRGQGGERRHGLCLPRRGRRRRRPLRTPDRTTRASWSRRAQGMLTLATGNTFPAERKSVRAVFWPPVSGALGAGDIRMADGTGNCMSTTPLPRSWIPLTATPPLPTTSGSGRPPRTRRRWSSATPLSLAEKERTCGAGSSGYQWDYLTSRHWRTLSLTGRLDGYGELTLMGYTSTTAGGQDKWVSMFHICDESLAPGRSPISPARSSWTTTFCIPRRTPPPMRMPTTTSWPSGSPAPYSSSLEDDAARGTPRWT